MLLKTIPNPKQKIAYKYWADTITNEILYGGTKGCGKSHFGASCIFGDALMYEQTHYFIARKKLNDLRRFTIPTIKDVFRCWGLDLNDYAKYNGQDNFFTLYNESRVYLLDCKYLPNDPLFERFGSMAFTRGWIEEGGEVEEAAKANLRLSLGRKRNRELGLMWKLLTTGNPKKNWMFYDYVKPNDEGVLENNKAVIQAYPDDNVQYVGQDYVDNLASEKDPVRRARLYLGDWYYDIDPTRLIEYDAMNDMLTNNFRFIYENKQRYITTDIAMFGADKFTIWVWQGWKVLKVIVIDKCGGRKIVEKLNKVASEYGVPRSNICYDADGVGAYLKGDEGYFTGGLSFNNNGKTIKEVGQVQEYQNLRSQCWFGVARKINNNEVWVPREVLGEYKQGLFEELEQIKNHRPDMDGKLMVTPKPDIKKNIGRSTDLADPLMMRYIFDLKGSWSSYA